MAYGGRLGQDAQRVRDELGKGMETLRQMAASIQITVNAGVAADYYASLGFLPVPGDIVKVQFLSEVPLAGGSVNTIDLFAVTENGVTSNALVTQFDPDTLVAGVLTEKDVLAAGKGLAKNTRLVMYANIAAALGSDTAPPDISVIVDYIPTLGEVSYGTY